LGLDLGNDLELMEFLASEYGWTPDVYMGLSYRQIMALVKQALLRKEATARRQVHSDVAASVALSQEYAPPLQEAVTAQPVTPAVIRGKLAVAAGPVADHAKIIPALPVAEQVGSPPQHDVEPGVAGTSSGSHIMADDPQRISAARNTSMQRLDLALFRPSIRLEPTTPNVRRPRIPAYSQLAAP
jgi:hypothetical protein